MRIVFYAQRPTSSPTEPGASPELRFSKSSFFLVFALLLLTSGVLLIEHRRLGWREWNWNFAAHCFPKPDDKAESKQSSDDKAEKG